MSFHELIARYRRWKSIHETIAALECLPTGEMGPYQRDLV